MDTCKTAYDAVASDTYTGGDFPMPSGNALRVAGNCPEMTQALGIIPAAPQTAPATFDPKARP